MPARSGNKPLGSRARAVLRELRALADPRGLEGMAAFGIATDRALGVSLPKMRELARRVGTDHHLALELWASGIHEARILASLVDTPDKVTEEQMELWVSAFDSWDVVDVCCASLFDRTPFAYRKAVEWTDREEEFVKRAGFVLMAALAVHDKEAPDRVFGAFLPLIERHATDRRNFVRKAVNWALRQIGKRSLALNREAVASAIRIQSGPRAGAWVASDALRELRGEAVLRRLQARADRPHGRAGPRGGASTRRGQPLPG